MVDELPPCYECRFLVIGLLVCFAVLFATGVLP
jgi:hypothetical protein